MKLACILALAGSAVFFCAQNAHAQTTPSQLDGLLGSAKSVKAYKSSSKDKEGMLEIMREEIPAPLDIQAEEANGMVKVKLKSEEYWVDSTRFKRKFAVPAPGCKLAGNANGNLSTRGVGEGCNNK